MNYTPYSPDPAPKKNNTILIAILAAMAAVVVTLAAVIGIGWFITDGPGAEQSSAEEEATNQARELAAQITTCDNHDRVCHTVNSTNVKQIDQTLTNQSPDLENGIIDFQNEYRSFQQRNCGANTLDVACGIAGMNMNLAASSIKVEVNNQDSDSGSNPRAEQATSRHPSADNPNLGLGRVDTVRDAVPAVTNVSDEAIEDAAEAVCSEMAAGVDPKDAANMLADAVPNMGVVGARMFTLSASLEFCPDVLPEDAFN